MQRLLGVTVVVLLNAHYSPFSRSFCEFQTWRRRQHQQIWIEWTTFNWCYRQNSVKKNRPWFRGPLTRPLTRRCLLIILINNQDAVQDVSKKFRYDFYCFIKKVICFPIYVSKISGFPKSMLACITIFRLDSCEFAKTELPNICCHCQCRFCCKIFYTSRLFKRL